MNKWKIILYWSFGIAAIITVSAFSSGNKEDIRYSGMNISVDYHTGLLFVGIEEIEGMIRAEYPYLDSLYLREINIPMLEESIDNHPSIRKAEVYSDLDGSLSIDIIQKTPIVRVQNSGASYYIDEMGDIMSLSPGFSASVPLVNGSLNADEQQRIFKFFMQIREDKFYQNFFSGLQVAPNGEWNLYPRPGNHRIIFGKPEEVTNKLNRLKKFYNSIVNEKNLDSLKTINLKFRGQVICRKH